MRYFQVNIRENPTELGYMPTLRLYLLEERDKPRPIVIIAPGGGYASVSAEDDRVVSQYNAAGFHAAVLQYSVRPHCFPEPEQDLMLAIGLVRERAEEWGILKDRVAICGFSAGGHLCACVSTLWKKLGEERFKPNAAILCHAVLTARLDHCKKFIVAHVGSEDDTIWAKPAGGRDYNYIRMSVEWMRELWEL